jgi:hypothetical protein
MSLQLNLTHHLGRIKALRNRHPWTPVCLGCQYFDLRIIVTTTGLPSGEFSIILRIGTSKNLSIAEVDYKSLLLVLLEVLLQLGRINNEIRWPGLHHILVHLVMREALWRDIGGISNDIECAICRVNRSRSCNGQAQKGKYDRDRKVHNFLDLG